MTNFNVKSPRETFLMKIGLKEERWGDEQLVEKLLDMMQQTGADFTATFRQLGEVSSQFKLTVLVIGKRKGKRKRRSKGKQSR